MTLHRRGVSRNAPLAALGEQLEGEYREALRPALTAPGAALERLELALDSLCGVADTNLELLDALGHAERDAVFHEQAGRRSPSGCSPSPSGGCSPTARPRGRSPSGPEETATVLFNLVGHTYRHLRTDHGWSREAHPRGRPSTGSGEG